MTFALAMFIAGFSGALAAGWWQFCAWEEADKRRQREVSQNATCPLDTVQKQDR